METKDINETNCIQNYWEKFQGELSITAVGSKWSCKGVNIELRNKD